ncbi:MAG TPA: AAA family ATPase, partial [Anaerolineae bacterium]|nr:AAA family ATPase [Anaerolineae bacterium]
MPFAQRRPLPQPEPAQALFAGRERELGLYRLHFHRPADHPEVRLITMVSGPGGVGKTRLLDELEGYQPLSTIYSRLNNTAQFGFEATSLLWAIADGLHRAGESIPTPTFDRLYQRRYELLERALTRRIDHKTLISQFYRVALLGLEGPAGVPKLNQFTDLRWPERDLNLVFGDPIGLLTEALVEDLNQAVLAGAEPAPLDEARATALAPATGKIVLIFDDFDLLHPAARTWLLTHLLDQTRPRINCDLRLIIAGRANL